MTRVSASAAQAILSACPIVKPAINLCLKWMYEFRFRAGIKLAWTTNALHRVFDHFFPLGYPAVRATANNTLNIDVGNPAFRIMPSKNRHSDIAFSSDSCREQFLQAQVQWQAEDHSEYQVG